MKKLFLKLSKLTFVMSVAFMLSSCVNIDQQTTINKDGSGNIVLHYWTATSNLSMGDELGGFSFTEDQIKKKFTSLNSDITELKIETKESDSTTHVKVKISFNDLNKLNEAEGFSKVNTVWKKTSDGFVFNYILFNIPLMH